MQFEWDEAKNLANIAKHGVGFETAARIFDGPVVSRVDGRADYGERRLISVGRIAEASGPTLVIVHTERAGRVRIISARPASKRERRHYAAILARADTSRDRGSP